MINLIEENGKKFVLDENGKKQPVVSIMHANTGGNFQEEVDNTPKWYNPLGVEMEGFNKERIDSKLQSRNNFLPYNYLVGTGRILGTPTGNYTNLGVIDIASHNAEVAHNDFAYAGYPEYSAAYLTEHFKPAQKNKSNITYTDDGGFVIGKSGTYLLTGGVQFYYNKSTHNVSTLEKNVVVISPIIIPTTDFKIGTYLYTSFRGCLSIDYHPVNYCFQGLRGEKFYILGGTTFANEPCALMSELNLIYLS